MTLEQPQGTAEKILNLGEQPLAALLVELGLKPHDLVAASTEQITHKMVTRGCKGRRLSRTVQAKLLRAFNTAAGKSCTVTELFNY